MRGWWRALIALSLVGIGTSAPGAPGLAKPEELAIPGGDRGIGYDDLQYAPELKRILVPAGRTGRLVLIDPATRAVSLIEGFSATASFGGGHGEGTTSAAEMPSGHAGVGTQIVATDRGSRTLKLVVVKKSDASVVGSIELAATPDYVRAVPGTREVWVTEPGRKQVEVLRVDEKAAGGLARVAALAVPDGPESLVIDADHGRAYSHTWKDQSYAIDLRARKVVSTWRNGCRESRGIALDGKRGLLFAGCAEGKATVVDLATGKVVAAADAGRGVDSIGYAATLGHLYVPGSDSADLRIFGVSSDGHLTLLGRAATAAGAHTAAFDPATSSIFVGAPRHGSVLVFRDPFPGF